MKLIIDFCGCLSCAIFPCMHIGQWTQNAIKHQMCSCHRITHTHHVQRIQHIHTIERHYRIPVNVCPVRTSNTQHPVHMKSDVFKHHVVFQKRPFSPEGKQFIHHLDFDNFFGLSIIDSYFLLIVGVMSHEHHTVIEHKRYQLVAVAVELHLGL